MNLLITDDEMIVVKGLLAGIAWEECGITQVYTAYGAEDSRRVCEKYHIDILLCDIEMPGENGIELVRWVRENYPEALIVRLPGLFGEGIKKNFIYDIINVIPFMLSETKMGELSSQEAVIEEYYEIQDNGFWKCRNLNEGEKNALRNILSRVNFSALQFTDSRSEFQFYPLKRLWSDIKIALENKIELLHTATEPISAGEIYKFLYGREFMNETASVPAKYDYRTRYSGLYKRDGGYIMGKEEGLLEIQNFVKSTKIC